MKTLRDGVTKNGWSWRVSWAWGNWTFGAWAGRPTRNKQARGIDLGPLEIVWRRWDPKRQFSDRRRRR